MTERTNSAMTVNAAEGTQIVLPRPEWHELLDAVSEGETLFIGRVGSGKTTLVHWLATQLFARGVQVGIVTCDMGQPMFGIPGAMWASWGGASSPVVGWFIGDNSPVGNLVPAVTGAAALVNAARQAGCQAVLVDTTGLVDGPLGRLLKLHKALAIGAARAVLIDGSGLTGLKDVLERAGLEIRCIAPSPHARNRSWEERRAYREGLLRTYFSRTHLLSVPADRVLTADWHAGLTPTAAATAPGRLCGLLDERMYCRALGIVDALGVNSLFVRTPVTEAAWLRCVQLGRLQLTMRGEEVRRLDR